VRLVAPLQGESLLREVRSTVSTEPHVYAKQECPFCGRTISVSKKGQMRGHQNKDRVACRGGWRWVTR
jgi:hypothetical protein